MDEEARAALAEAAEAERANLADADAMCRELAAGGVAYLWLYRLAARWRRQMRKDYGVKDDGK
jgi:hypothetical protein